MNVSQVLDTAIGTLLFLVIFSAAASAGLEAVLAARGARSRALNATVQAMLNSLSADIAHARPLGRVAIASAKHPSVNSVVDRGVTHIAPGEFAARVIDCIQGGSATRSAAPVLATAVSGRLGTDPATIDLPALRAALIDWFNETMAELNAKFRTNSFKQLAWAGGLVSLAANASVLNVATTLWNSATIRAAAIEAAGKASAPSTPAELNEALKQLDQLSVLQLPIGWGVDGHLIAETFASPGSVLFFLVGCLVTGLLTGMGAQYWYDLLTSLLKRRGDTGSAHGGGASAAPAAGSLASMGVTSVTSESGATLLTVSGQPALGRFVVHLPGTAPEASALEKGLEKLLPPDAN